MAKPANYQEKCKELEAIMKGRGLKAKVSYDVTSHKYVCDDETGRWVSSDGEYWERNRESIKLGNEFVKHDTGKLQWSILPFEELEDVVRVLMHGAEKYTVDNWKKCEDTDRYKDALMRHVIAYTKGEKIDNEFGLSHLAHAVCNCLFLMWFDKHKEEDKND